MPPWAPTTLQHAFTASSNPGKQKCACNRRLKCEGNYIAVKQIDGAPYDM